jgi:hypothetical protein
VEVRLIANRVEVAGQKVEVKVEVAMQQGGTQNLELVGNCTIQWIVASADARKLRSIRARIYRHWRN